MAISQHGTSVLFTSHPKDGMVVNLYIPHNRRMPLQAEEALGPISIPRGSRGVGPFKRTSASRTEKPGAYSTPGTHLGGGAGGEEMADNSSSVLNDILLGMLMVKTSNCYSYIQYIAHAGQLPEGGEDEHRGPMIICVFCVRHVF